MKVCTGCHTEKPLTEFHRDRHQKDGYKFRCRSCCNVATQQWFQDHPEYQRGYRAANRDALAAYNSDYYVKHRDERAGYTADYYVENKDRLRPIRRRWNEENREHRNARQVDAYWADPDTARAKSRNRWRDPSRTADRAARRRARLLGQWVESVSRAVVYERDRGVCGLCHLAVPPSFWELGHIIPLRRDGPHSYANTRVEHPSCNAWKGDRLDSELPPMPLYILTKARHEAELALAA